MKKPLKLKKNLHIKFKDIVRIISGKSKGKIGMVKIIIKKKSQIIVEGINFKNKFSKQNRPGEGGLINRIEFPIHSSNVAIYKE